MHSRNRATQETQTFHTQITKGSAIYMWQQVTPFISQTCKDHEYAVVVHAKTGE